MRTVALMVVLAGTWQACGQGTVKLILPDTNAYLREVITAEIELRDFERAGEPVLPEMPGFTVGRLSRPSESSFTQIRGGRMTKEVTRTYRFELTPMVTGDLSIPPISVEVDGRALRTRPARIRVRGSDAGGLFSAELKCDQPRLYVGQRAEVTLTIWVRPAVVDGTTFTENNMWGQIEGRALGPFTDRVRVRTVPDSESKTGTRYGYVTSTMIVPKSAGPLNVENLAISIAYPTALRRDVFGRLTVSQSRRLRVTPTSDVEVLPLPVVGRPDIFGGAVGHFEIRSRAEATNVRVGDPIELTIEVSGDGPVESLGPPRLASSVAMNDSFRVPTESLAGEVYGQTKRFTQVIRAKRADVSEIPPVEYAYFDPQRGEYATARSRAIPINVSAVESLQASDLAGIAPPEANGSRLEALDGLRGNETSELLLLANHRPIQAWQVMAATAVAPALFALVWAPLTLRRRRRGDVRGRRRQAALARARGRIDKARLLEPVELAHEIRASMSGYLADRLDQPAGRYDGAASTDCLRERGVDSDLIAAWSDIIDQCELASFGGNINGDASVLADRARECLVRVERDRL